MANIEKKAYEKYPSVLGFPLDERVDLNEEARNAHIKACEEYESLPKIRGWVVRDQDGELNVTIGKTKDEKPFRDEGMWDSDFHLFYKIDNSLFPEITWESEPVKVELLIRRK